jgi:L-ascorbate metabolism protein UlaG (beta-lactamase superfamily)
MSLRAMLGTAAAISFFASLVSIGYAFPQHSEPAASGLPEWNDNSLIEIQRNGGSPARPGNVRIEFYGHNAFKVTSPSGLTILTDPWRNDPSGAYPKWFLAEFPPLRVDIVVSTHAHFDHDAVERPMGLVVFERLVGQFKLGDVEITGLADKHQCQPTTNEKSDSTSEGQQRCPPNNVIGLDNAIQIIATGGFRIAVWGDNRGTPDPSLEHYLHHLDLLVLPVDNVLTRPEVERIIRKYDPKAIIPAHYFVEGLTTAASGLEPVDSWVNDEEKINHVDVRRLPGAELTLNPAELKASRLRVYYFGSHFEKQ